LPISLPMAPTILGLFLYGYYTYSFSINIGGRGVHPQLFFKSKIQKAQFHWLIIFGHSPTYKSNMLSSPQILECFVMLWFVLPILFWSWFNFHVGFLSGPISFPSKVMPCRPNHNLICLDLEPLSKRPYSLFFCVLLQITVISVTCPTGPSVNSTILIFLDFYWIFNNKNYSKFNSSHTLSFKTTKPPLYKILVI
jgi:hypothetical protein